MINKKGFGKWLTNYDIRRGRVLLILLIITLLPLLMLSFYNHPCSDDYFVTVLERQKGFFGAQKYWYFNWNGRYFFDICISLNTLVFNFYRGYKLNAIVFLFLLLIATYWLGGKLFKDLDKTGKTGITSLFFFACIMRMPDIASGIFWQSDMYACLIPVILAFFLMGCIISYYHSAVPRHTIGGSGVWYFILSCLLAIAIIGCYEIDMVFIDLIVALIVIVSILKKQVLFFPLTLLAVCIIFSILSITAPGNNARGLDYPNAHRLLFSIKESILCSRKFLIHWLPFMLFIGFLLFDLLSGKNLWNKATDSIFIIPPWLSLIACLALPVIGLFICFWAEGEFPPLRTIDVSYFYFVAGIFYFSFSLMSRIKKRYPDFSLPVYIKLPLYLILVFILVFRTNNITVAYKDITSGIASAYNKERMERHEFLTNFKGDSCMIDSIKNIPKSLFFSELPRDTASNSTKWIYTSFCQYYHKKYIGIRGRPYYPSAYARIIKK